MTCSRPKVQIRLDINDTCLSFSSPFFFSPLITETHDEKSRPTFLTFCLSYKDVVCVFLSLFLETETHNKVKAYFSSGTLDYNHLCIHMCLAVPPRPSPPSPLFFLMTETHEKVKTYVSSETRRPAFEPWSF